MDKESKQIIERLMQEGLALKALLHRSGIVFYEADTSHLEGKSCVNPVNLETRILTADTFSMVAVPIEPKKQHQPLETAKALWFPRRLCL